MKNWRLKDGRYDYCGDISIMDPQNRYSVSGRQLLSDNASRQLETGVNSFFEENVLPLKDPRTRSLLSQSLSGFNDMLLMRDQMKLLPLFSTDGLVKASLSLLQALPSDEMGTAAVFDRLFSPFVPVFWLLAEYEFWINWEDFRISCLLISIAVKKCVP